MDEPSWAAFQIGAREDYALARLLCGSSRLAFLMTDVWVRPGAERWLGSSARARRLRQRFHPDLADAYVRSIAARWTAARTGQALVGRSGWTAIHQRNRLFGRRGAALLRRELRRRPIAGVIAYSYAALEILHAAREHGLRAALVQIDAGPFAQSRYESGYSESGHPRTGFEPPPSSYWEDWYRECAVADRILVHSDWTGDALIRAGIDARKLIVLKPAYEVYPANAAGAAPARSAGRPFTVAYAGAVSIEKGMAVLFRAARLVEPRGIRFALYGRIALSPAFIEREMPSNVTLHGPVLRAEIPSVLQQADLFVFPTLSDGFGLVQVDAQAAGLPVVASPHCAKVVHENESGITLPHLSAEALAAAIVSMADDPIRLASMAAAAPAVAQAYSIERAGPAWIDLLDAMAAGA